MPISKPLFEFAAAACTTDLLDLRHRFHRAIDILDDKTCLSFNNNFGDGTVRKTDYWRTADKPGAIAAVSRRLAGFGLSMCIEQVIVILCTRTIAQRFSGIVAKSL